MAIIIELPNGAFYNNGLPWEDQSVAAQDWYNDNFSVWSETYMFLGGLWTSNMVSLPVGYSGNWDNKKSKTNQNQDGEEWYDDAAPIFSKLVRWSKAGDNVTLLRQLGGEYDNQQPLAAQATEVEQYTIQLVDQARRLAVLQDVLPDEIMLPNSEIWDNNLPYTAQTAGAQVEADLLWSGGNDFRQKQVVDGSSFVDQKINATWRLTIDAPSSQDYFIENI